MSKEDIEIITKALRRLDMSLLELLNEVNKANGYNKIHLGDKVRFWLGKKAGLLSAKTAIRRNDTNK